MLVCDIRESLDGVNEIESLLLFAEQQGGSPVFDEGTLRLADLVGVDLHRAVEALHFDGELGGAVRLVTAEHAIARLLILSGLGESPDMDAIRSAAGAGARALKGERQLGICIPTNFVNASNGNVSGAAQAMVEGVALGAYRFEQYRTRDVATRPERLFIVTDGSMRSSAEAGARRGAVVAEATCQARDFVNEPPQAKRPEQLANRFLEAASEVGIDGLVHDLEMLREGGFGGIVGVGRGSSAPPCMVELQYRHHAATRHVVLVGKGVTFDTGGLSLKPTSMMTLMKADMSGAAAVVCAMVAASNLDLPINVTGLLPLAENMPSGDATRVTDVLRMRSGLTVEVLNTDAEGRLILADALAYATEQSPDAIIDIATLTGASIMALGWKVGAVIGSNADLVTTVLMAARRAGEPLWQLPLHEAYMEEIRGSVADLRNVAKDKYGGAIMAALFLREFVPGMSWAHLDVPGPSFLQHADEFTQPEGGTGMGVRTLVELLEGLSRERPFSQAASDSGTLGAPYEPNGSD